MGWLVYGCLGLLAGFLPRMVFGAGSDDFGALLGLGSATSGGGLGEELGDRLRNFVFWAGLFVLLGLLAFITNPTDSAFRSFLTELSFRRHLRDLHRPAAPEADEGVPGQLKARGGGSQSLPLTSSSTASSADPSSASAATSSTGSTHHVPVPPSPAPFRFTNRVSISLRTPPYAFHSFGLFSIVAVPADASSSSASSAAASAGASQAAGRPKWLVDPPGEHDALLAGVWFLGAFGKWWLMGAFRGLGEDKDAHAKAKESPASAPKLGVRDVKALDGSEDAVAAVLHKKGLDIELPPPYSHSPPPSPRQAQARLCKSRQHSRRPSLEDHPAAPIDPTTTNSTTTTTPDVPTTSGLTADQQLQQHQPAPPAPVPAPPEQQPTLPSIPQIDPSILAANPPLSELHQALQVSQQSTADLLAQLSQTSAASTASHAQLQATIEELRARKAQEDADRLEVKTRTKTLEESKRQAEAAKRDADKKCRQAEALRDAVLARIDELTREMDQARARMAAQRDEVTASKEKVELREREIKDEMVLKKKKLALQEVRVGGMLNDVKELEGLVRYEEDSLEHAKHDAIFQIEEARKLMASYSTFGNGQFRPRTVESDLYTAHSQPPSNIVNSSLPNPASSIFDLPIQQLPLSLLQRRRNEPSAPPAGSLHNNSMNPRFGHADRNPSSSHLNDVFGFEDFGPGVQPRTLNRYSTASRESLQAVVAAAASHPPAVPSHLPPQHHQPYLNSRSQLQLAQLASEDSSEDDMMGSPNIMSASFTDLLPRGLFQSLSADGLLSPDPDKDALRHAKFAFHDGDSDDEGDVGAEGETEVGDGVLSDKGLPSSPRSVLSSDPRSLLLEGPADGEEISSGPQHSASQSAAFCSPNGLSAAPATALSDLSPNSMPFVPTLHPTSSPSARNSTDSLVLPTMPAASSNSYGASPGGGAGSRFFSSIRAFAPSAAERQALTRALRQNNGSNRSLDATGDIKHSQPPSPPAQAAGAVPFYANGARLSQQRSASPFGTPRGSSSDLNRDYIAAAAWDVPVRPDESRTRTKSFSRFFGLGSSFSRKDKDESVFSTSPSSSSTVTVTDSSASNSTGLNSDWAPNWKKHSPLTPRAVMTPGKVAADGWGKSESAVEEDGGED